MSVSVWRVRCSPQRILLKIKFRASEIGPNESTKQIKRETACNCDNHTHLLELEHAITADSAATHSDEKNDSHTLFNSLTGWYKSLFTVYHFPGIIGKGNLIRWNILMEDTHTTDNPCAFLIPPYLMSRMADEHQSNQVSSHLHMSPSWRDSTLE